MWLGALFTMQKDQDVGETAKSPCWIDYQPVAWRTTVLRWSTRFAYSYSPSSDSARALTVSSA